MAAKHGFALGGDVADEAEFQVAQADPLVFGAVWRVLDFKVVGEDLDDDCWHLDFSDFLW